MLNVLIREIVWFPLRRVQFANAKPLHFGLLFILLSDMLCHQEQVDDDKKTFPMASMNGKLIFDFKCNASLHAFIISNQSVAIKRK